MELAGRTHPHSAVAWNGQGAVSSSKFWNSHSPSEAFGGLEQHVMGTYATIRKPHALHFHLTTGPGSWQLEDCKQCVQILSEHRSFLRVRLLPANN